MVRRKTSDSDEQQNTISDRISFVFEETTFHWSEWDQQIILGSYWAGYLLTLIPSGWLSISLGAKLMSAIAIFLSSSATIALISIYYFENISFLLVVSLRILIGAAHGTLFPVTYTLWSQWAVPNERGTLASIGFSGTNIGTSLAVLVGGLFCRYIDSGWIYTFLLSGILGFIWLPLWLWQVSDAPENHRSISNAEREYIVGIIGKNSQRRSISLSALPWKTIVRSKPIIALFLTETCQLFALFFFLTNFGKILREIQQIPSQYTGYILACGFIFMLVGNISAGIAADNLVRRNFMTLVGVRKLFNSLGSFIPCLCMIVFCFCDEKRRILGVINAILFLLSSGFSYGSGYIVNYADVVPAYAGLIFGIVTTISSFGAVIANIIAGIVIKQPILEDWRKLYILFGIVYLVGGLAFMLWASATPEKWATLESQQEKETIEETVPMKESEPNDIGTRRDEHLYINA
ncbi:unnamed protein product [Adineta ricciae]|uniref:Major facilitator superfamily (MFS) profile domain-containing protein n=1 Tax=Adineta ricciae TaxID=249248 RepID=A0A815V9T7_ADIRI|nr:unnamed protein product [Adineta ricciae]